MNFNNLLATLHPLERTVLPVLKQNIDFESILETTNLSETEVLRALQWLENKGLVKVKQDIKEIIEPDVNGKQYLKEGLPEKKLLKIIAKYGESNLDEAKKNSSLSPEEFGVSLGILKKINAIIILQGKLRLTESGKELANKGLDLPQEALLKKLPLDVSQLNKEENQIFEDLRKRKQIVKTEIKRLRRITLTELGEKLSSYKINTGFIDALAPRMLEKGEWKDKQFRRYDLQSKVPRIFAGRKQHYRKFLDEVRVKFLALGFKEMFGPIVETEFWNMDALFMPQFHSARDIHDAYYVKDPKYKKLDEELVKKVKEAHESGFKTGSKGWQYKFDVQRTHRTVLRSQGTALSSRTLASKELKIPGKYFAIARCFRYDVIDATHLPDFNQIEGIVAEEGLNFKHLKGLLKLFAEEFGETETIRVVPGYFPFTEPSAELHAKHPELGWIELGGSGIFRPEVTKPFGVNVPVIAWGLGLDRLAMLKLKINDIRQLFSHDLAFLKSARII
ncbi:phenylalanine--tRNA ligase subunit alpha [Candidatus Woesearchaeota archaeon]|nr:phenylalanine--tRNA ligase subunit alpha [Candidatus Woesearchaeota archaeon]